MGVIYVPILEPATEEDYKVYGDFTRRLLKAIEQDGRTLKEISKDSGVQIKTITGWITGRRLVDVGKLVRLTDSLCVSVDWLLGRKEDQKM